MFKPSEVWIDNAEKRELAMKKRLYLGLERWSEKTRPQSQLSPGQAVYIQNQRGMGKASKIWDRSGIVLEDNGYDKYTIKVDGSNRVINRNRKYLRCFTPENSQLLRGPRTNTQDNEKSNYAQVDDGTPVTVQTPTASQPNPLVERVSPVPSQATEPPHGGETSESLALVPVPTTARDDAAVKSEPVVGSRRSSRVRHENSKYSRDLYDMSG